MNIEMRTRGESSARAAAVLGAVALLAGCGLLEGPAKRDAKTLQVERGKYLVAVTGCNDCHTPLKLGPSGPKPDMSRMLSGHPEALELGPPPTLGEGGWLWAGAKTNTAFAGPWGLSVARNITPDEATGIGAWTEEMFVRAMKTGKQFGSGRALLPPMPWPSYAQATDEDLKAIFAYVRSIPPIKNKAPDSIAR